jgi:Uma2 family endonuclease
MTETLLAPQSKAKAIQPHPVSLEAYFRMEEKALTKHEYHDGIIITMAGGKLPHNRLATKAVKLMDNFVEDNKLDYIVSNSDTKIRVEAYNKIVYPDAVVICEEEQFFQNREDTIINPLVIVEVLSGSTQKFDNTTKFEMYRTIPTFKEYVLIHQDRKHATVYTKQEDGNWLLRDYEGEEAVAILYALHNCPLPLSRLYLGLKLKK